MSGIGETGKDVLEGIASVTNKVAQKVTEKLIEQGIEDCAKSIAGTKKGINDRIKEIKEMRENMSKEKKIQAQEKVKSTVKFKGISR